MFLFCHLKITLSQLIISFNLNDSRSIMRCQFIIWKWHRYWHHIGHGDEWVSNVEFGSPFEGDYALEEAFVTFFNLSSDIA